MLRLLRLPAMGALVMTMIVAITWTGSLNSPASADEKPCAEMGWVDGTYTCIRYVSGGTPGTPGTGGETPGAPATPTCDLAGAGGTDFADQNRGPNFCQGENVCFNTDLLDLNDPPAGDPPKEGGEARVTWCYDGIMGPPNVVRIFWSDEEEPPSDLDQALEAIGNIDVGGATLKISPTGRTLVNLDTWFWLDGSPPEVTGSSAFGLVAIATFRGMNVDPGDGNGSMACPLVTSAAQAEESCFHTYRRTSNGGSASVDGRPAYQASATAVYDLRFEVGGNAIDVPGAPATLDAPATETPIRVDEVQSRVSGLN